MNQQLPAKAYRKHGTQRRISPTQLSPRAILRRSDPLRPDTPPRSNRRPGLKPEPLKIVKTRSSASSSIKRRGQISNLRAEAAISLARSPQSPQGHEWDLGNIYDSEDEHSSTQVDISLLSGDVHDVLQAACNERRSRESKPNYTKHVLESPPPSPGSIVSTPGTPESKLREARLHAEFRHKSLKELIGIDNSIHELGDQVQAIKEWWVRNKHDWLERRVIYRQREVQIENLKAQNEVIRKQPSTDSWALMILHGRGDEISDDVATTQIKYLEKANEASLVWFLENRQIMKKVWRSFKTLEYKVEAMARLTSDPTLSSSPVLQQKQPLAVEAASKLYQLTNDVRTLGFFQRIENVQKWIGKALIDMNDYNHTLSEEYARVEARRMSCEINVKNLNKQIQTKENEIMNRNRRVDQEVQTLRDQISNSIPITGNSAEEEIRRRIETRNASLKVESDELHMLKTERQAAELKLEGYRVRYRSIEDRGYRVGFIIEFLAFAQRASNTDNRPSHIYDRDLYWRMSDFMTTLYQLCYIQYQRRSGPSGTVRNILNQQQDMSFWKTKQILDNLNAHYQEHSFRRYEDTRAIINEGRIQEWTSQFMRSVVAHFDSEQLAFNALAAEATNIYNAPVNQKDPREYTDYKPSSKYKILEAPPVEFIRDLAKPLNLSGILNTVRGWGSNLTVQVARDLLATECKERIHFPGAPVTWGENLRALFVSPDMYTLFTSGRKFANKEDFTVFINTFVKYPVPGRYIDAFLIYCVHSNDLFHRGYLTGQISAIISGWETCVENSVAGPQRTILGKKPSFLREIEDRLLYKPDQRYWGVDPSDLRTWKRKISGLDLHTQINARLINGLTHGQFKYMLSWWTRAGTFYIVNDRSIDFNDRHLEFIRVDNGWNLTEYGRTGLREHPPFHREIREAIRFSEFAADWLTGWQLSEEQLYRQYFGVTRKSEDNWEVTRHRFHLSLRWFHENNYQFKLVGRSPNMMVEKHKNGWGPRGSGQ